MVSDTAKEGVHLRRLSCEGLAFIDRLLLCGSDSGQFLLVGGVAGSKHQSRLLLRILQLLPPVAPVGHLRRHGSPQHTDPAHALKQAAASGLSTIASPRAVCSVARRWPSTSVPVPVVVELLPPLRDVQDLLLVHDIRLAEVLQGPPHLVLCSNNEATYKAVTTITSPACYPHPCPDPT